MIDGKKEGPGESNKRSQILSDVLSAVLVAVVGFVLLNLAFMAFAGLHQLAFRVIGAFTAGGSVDSERFAPSVLRWVFLILMTGAFWLLYRSKLHVVLKAAFLMVPFATLLVLLGIEFYQRPVPLYIVSGLVGAALLLLLYKRKESWLYFLSTALVIVLMLVMALTGTEI